MAFPHTRVTCACCFVFVVCSWACPPRCLLGVKMKELTHTPCLDDAVTHATFFQNLNCAGMSDSARVIFSNVVMATLARWTSYSSRHAQPAQAAAPAVEIHPSLCTKPTTWCRKRIQLARGSHIGRLLVAAWRLKLSRPAMRT